MLASTRAAAMNNAEWCDVVCRLHGATTTSDDVAWTSRTRTPPHYPDAVTLAADLAVPELLARIDGSAGCSIKDSFASLDLRAHGFRVLFDAEWIVRPSGAIRSSEAGPRWAPVRDAVGLTAWEQAWRGSDGPSGLWRAELLDNEAVVVLAARTRNRVVAGAILNRSASVVGISNFFVEPAVEQESWTGCLALAETLFPGSILVGYESGRALEAAQACGFEPVGPLRVWLKG